MHYRTGKNSFQESFGPVIVTKSVLENLAGKVLFFVFVLGKNIRELFR